MYLYLLAFGCLCTGVSILETPAPSTTGAGQSACNPLFLILRLFFVRPILSMSGGRNAVKCKANTKYGHLSSKGAAGYFLPSVRLTPIGWPTLRACGTLIDSAAIA